ncbi:MAG TPA: glycosyltransferase [Bacteroidales bacterium]|nr:glycosyltransferase [Bacteroidales bacterium]
MKYMDQTYEYDSRRADRNGRKLNGKDVLGKEMHRIKDVLCFSHLRWNFVFQRPQHLLSRWAREHRVFFIEEPVFTDHESNFLKTVYVDSRLIIITPHVSRRYGEAEVNGYLRESVIQIVSWYQVSKYLLWYLTPMAVEFTSGLSPEITVYDSMDELSSFRGAHPNMLKNEERLMKMADVVFTGGQSLYEYKKHRHHNIHPFPSSIDQRHFESGIDGPDPADQSGIGHPRVGFFGVLDERLDIDLLDKLALFMPDVNFIMIGPVVKIDPASLPKHENIFYLGQKNYSELPFYLGGWDVAILPFAKNESTRFISPTKTPEYLAAGKPVVSTSIHDVVIPYGELGLVEIADDAETFAFAVRKLLGRKDKSGWELMVKDQLKGNSWDLTWTRMRDVIYNTLEEKKLASEAAVLAAREEDQYPGSL